MKTAILLHGTKGSSRGEWFPWLKVQLEEIGYLVWVPDLPNAFRPNITEYKKFIFENVPWDINTETILVGHSSGSVAILGLLQSLANEVKVKACYLVGSFKDNLGRDDLNDLFLEPFDFEKIKHKSRLFYFIHSDNDPKCPLEGAEYLHSQIGGDLLILPGQQHFSINTAGEQYSEFPYLFHLIAGDVMQAEDVVELYGILESNGVEIWLDGGWGVDALLETQTRPHGDLDIEVQKKDLQVLNELLKSRGYREILRSDTSAKNYMLGDDMARFVDIHVIEFDENGNGVYGPATDGFVFPAAAFSGKGKILGKEVNCISPEWVVQFHTGYELRENDFHDVLAICEKFGIKIPKEYQKK